jgi:hypothetical protein
MTTAKPPPAKRSRPAPPARPKGKAAVAADGADEPREDDAAAATSTSDDTSSSDGSDGNDSSSSGGPTVSTSDDVDVSASSGDEAEAGGDGDKEEEKITVRFFGFACRSHNPPVNAFSLSHGRHPRQNTLSSQVDFEFHDPAPIDYLGVRTLLLSLLDGGVFDVSGLASAVVAQTRVGTVVKTEDGGDPIALITALNTDRTPRGGGGAGGSGRSGAPAAATAPPAGGAGAPHPPPAFPPIPALAQLRDYLAASAPTPAAKTALLTAWAGPGTGLVLAERLANVPPQIAPPLHQALALEVKWATTDEPSEAGKASFDFERLLLVSRAFVEVGGDKGGSGGGAAGGELVVGGKATSPPTSPALVWARPEDEHFVGAADWAWWFRVPARAARPSDGLAPVRLVACVGVPKGWAAARAALDDAVGNPAAGDDGEG